MSNKIEFEDDNLNHLYAKEINQILLTIAPCLMPEGMAPEEWVDKIFISNKSTLSDFLDSGIESGAMRKVLSDRFGKDLQFDFDQYLHELANDMKDKGLFNE